MLLTLLLAVLLQNVSHIYISSVYCNSNYTVASWSTYFSTMPSTLLLEAASLMSLIKNSYAHLKIGKLNPPGPSAKKRDSGECPSS